MCLRTDTWIAWLKHHEWGGDISELGGPELEQPCKSLGSNCGHNGKKTYWDAWAERRDPCCHRTILAAGRTHSRSSPRAGRAQEVSVAWMVTRAVREYIADSRYTLRWGITGFVTGLDVRYERKRGSRWSQTSRLHSITYSNESTLSTTTFFSTSTHKPGSVYWQPLLPAARMNLGYSDFPLFVSFQGVQTEFKTLSVIGFCRTCFFFLFYGF